jgi:hypothetical protein
MLIYVEIIPRELTDIVSKSLKDVPHARGAVDDACGYQTLDSAIVNSERVALSVFRKVKPENLLFVFCKTIESLFHVEIELPFSPPIFYDVNESYNDCNNKKSSRKNEYSPDNRAIILCKIINADIFDIPFWTKKKKGSGTTERYEISWRELQEFKKMLND